MNKKRIPTGHKDEYVNKRANARLKHLLNLFEMV